MWTEFNPNPINRRVGDCSVRAIAKALNVSWGKAYALLTFNGYQMGDMPSSDAVWGSVLRQHGFSRSVVPNTCPECYKIHQVCDGDGSRRGRHVIQELL